MSTISGFFPSFDTIRLVIPTQHTDEDLKSRFGEVFYQRQVHFNSVKISEKTSIPLLRPQDLDKLPSSHSPIAASICDGFLTVQFSMPKAMYSHSASHFGDYHRFMQALEQVFKVDFALSFKGTWRDWILKRIDWCWNLNMQTPERCENIERTLKRLRFLSSNAYTSGRKTYAYWPSRTRTVKFYIKGREMALRKNADQYPAAWLIENQAHLDSILRYEEEWRPQFLQRFCQVERADHVTCGIFADSLAAWNPDTHFKTVQGQFTLRNPVSNINEAIHRVNATFRKQAPYVEVLKAINNYGFDEGRVHLNLSESTWHYRKSKLKKAGIDLNIIATSTDRDSLPAVDLSHIFNSENIDNSFDADVHQPDYFYSFVRMRYNEIIQSEINALTLV